MGATTWRRGHNRIAKIGEANYNPVKEEYKSIWFFFVNFRIKRIFHHDQFMDLSIRVLFLKRNVIVDYHMYGFDIIEFFVTKNYKLSKSIR